MSKCDKLFYKIENGKMKLLFEIEDILFGIWNISVFLDDILHYKENRFLLTRNNKLKKNDLDECYIILNGPSLKEVNLMKLKDKDTFTVNFFYRQKIWPNFVSKYHVMVEPDAFERVDKEGKKIFQDIDNYLKHVYGLNDDIKFIVNSRWYDNMKRIFLDLDRIYFIKGRYMPRFDITKARFDISKVMTSAFGVAGTSIAVAMSMGYKKIYLLGFDGNQRTYKSPIKHFCDNEVDKYEYNISNDEEQMLFSSRTNAVQSPIFYILKMHAEKNNINIINLTETSLVNTFPFANFDDVINKD